jgi:hypothetical protein
VLVGVSARGGGGGITGNEVTIYMYKQIIYRLEENKKKENKNKNKKASDLKLLT